jgi:hypothetical protein
MLEDFDDCKRGAGENGFLTVEGWVEESGVLVHVEDVFVAETFNVFV